tara:strand:- start:221 stop:808 length:588 start_codon:yes stop_codon:yes gene_type:complete
MKYLRHDFTDNLYTLPTGVREAMVLDEISKLINLSRKATLDAMKICGVDINDDASKNTISKELCKNWNNLKLRNKLAKMIVLINARTDEDVFVNFDGEETSSVRDMMQKGKKYVDKYKDKINDIAYSIGQSLKLKSSSKVIENNIVDYDSFGSTLKPKAGLKHTIKESEGNGNWSFLALVGMLGLATMMYMKYEQ